MASVNRPTLAGLQAQVEALRHNLNLVETERDSLRMKVNARTQELVGLNEAYAKLAGQFDELTGRLAELRGSAINPVRSNKPVAAIISERRAAMQRAREEAMATGRFVKV